MTEKHVPLPPTPEVVSQFGGTAKPVLLSGGEGQSFRSGQIVLKPVQDLLQTIWIADLLSQITEAGFRINKPVRSKTGSWVVDGWQAFEFLAGEEVKGNGKAKIDVSRKFHHSLRDVPKPDFIGKRDIPWELADKIVWNELPEQYGEKVSKVTDRLMAVKKPLDLPAQLIHGDMTGNILFSEGAAPAIIDFSPYWRPAEYANAIIIVDSIVWEGSDDAVLNEMPNTFENNQLLIRAALWRIKTTEIFSEIHKSDPTREVEQYHHFIDLLVHRVI